MLVHSKNREDEACTDSEIHCPNSNTDDCKDCVLLCGGDGHTRACEKVVLYAHHCRNVTIDIVPGRRQAKDMIIFAPDNNGSVMVQSYPSDDSDNDIMKGLEIISTMNLTHTDQIMVDCHYSSGRDTCDELRFMVSMQILFNLTAMKVNVMMWKFTVLIHMQTAAHI